jgi:hypothetical protein
LKVDTQAGNYIALSQLYLSSLAPGGGELVELERKSRRTDSVYGPFATSHALSVET